MRYVCLGLTGHVDAGKTTLSEALLFESGTIRRTGRVDAGDAFLDTHAIEKARGITIFSKQAVVKTDAASFILVDTPGHVDFSAETERALAVLDAAVLIVSGHDGVQAHTKTLWDLMERRQIPVFLFVNKMDQPGTDREKLMAQLREELDSGCTDFTERGSDAFFEEICMRGDDALLDRYLEEGSGAVTEDAIAKLIRKRRVFPCFFGSALKDTGVKEFLQGLCDYAGREERPSEFGARVLKVTRDPDGNLLTWLKITGGTLKARQALKEAAGDKDAQRVQQIRFYSGERFEPLQEAQAGMLVAVTGPDSLSPGEGFGWEKAGSSAVLEPVLNYRVLFEEGTDPFTQLAKFRQLEQEDPKLHVTWDEERGEITVSLMGEVQKEVLITVVRDRFRLNIAFSEGRVAYKETVAAPVTGIGHFEPLRHYAEVHLLIEPGEQGSGLVFSSACSTDDLELNWQRLILTHLAEKEHRGVLTGSPVTDLRITLLAGRAHLKHTEGGDFRQATYRAVRQGLMRAESVLLEPVYDFELDVPETALGRAMSDLSRMHADFVAPQQKNGRAVLTGTVPVSETGDYPVQVAAYTKGEGRITLKPAGYVPCHNTQEVLAQFAYDPERDTANPAGSVFCSHGAGYPVPWNEVEANAHIRIKI